MNVDVESSRSSSLMNSSAGDDTKDDCEEVVSEEVKILKNKKQSTLLYKVTEQPSIPTSILLGFQNNIILTLYVVAGLTGASHYLMTIGGNIANPLIISRAMCMFETEEGLMGRATMLSTILLISGATTFCQTTFGVRLPTMQGIGTVFIAASYAFLEMPHNICPDPIPGTGLNGTRVMYNDTDGLVVDGTELWQRRMREIQGGMIVGSTIELLLGLTGCVGVIVKYIGPLAISSAIITMGISLIKAAYSYSSTHWGIAIGTMAVLVLCSQYLGNVFIRMPVKKSKRGVEKVKLPVFKLFPVLFAVGFGCALSGILTATNVLSDDPLNREYRARSDNRIGVLYSSSWFRFPYPGQFGTPIFTSAGIIAMTTAIIASIADSLGDYFACSRIVEAGHPPAHAVNRGIVLEAIGCIFNGLMGTPGGTTTHAANTGTIAVTRVASRSAFQCAGITMIVLGIFGKFGAILVMIPDPVLGGIMMVILSMIVAVGLSNLQNVNLHSPRNMFILGFSIFVGSMISVYIKANPGVIDTQVKEVNQALTIFLRMSMLTSAILAIFFDYTLPGRVPFNIQQDAMEIEDKAKIYDLPFTTDFKYAKYIPFLPAYKQKQ